jgi:hypothetical protein
MTLIADDASSRIVEGRYTVKQSKNIIKLSVGMSSVG